MYNDLQDALGYRMDQNAPFNPSYSIANLPVADLPLPSLTGSGECQDRAGRRAAGPVDPDADFLVAAAGAAGSPNTVFTLGYVGSHGYHEIVSLDDNEPTPAACPGAPCPAVYPSTFPRRTCRSTVPAGSYYIPAGTPLANPALGAAWAWFSRGDSSYNALQINLNHRLSQGLLIRGVYTWSKALDDGDSLNATARRQRAGAGFKSVRYEVRLGPGNLRCHPYGIHQRGIQAAVRHAPALPQRRRKMDKPIHGRMDRELHRRAAVRAFRLLRSSAITPPTTETQRTRCARS